MELSIVLSLVLVLLSILWWKVSRPKSFPPGPLALPIIGNLLHVDFSNPLQGLKELSEVHGPVYSIYLGTKPAVVVRGFKALKEVLLTRGPAYADRPLSGIIQAISGNTGIVVARYGHTWKAHKRFTMSTLRNFGLGKKSMEERIAEESVYLIQEFHKKIDTMFDPHFDIDNAVSNVICSIVFGKRYGYGDSTLRDVLHLVHENMMLSTGLWAQIYNAFGFIHYLPLPHQKIFRNAKAILGFLEEVLEEHRRTRTPGKPRDYIDRYLDELDKERELEYNKKTFDDRNLFTCVLDLFVGGTETTSSTLTFSLMYMMTYPDVQEKCRNEIDNVRGNRDCLDYEDRLKTPYTQAFLLEVLRFANIVPFAVPHSTLRDEQLNGFTIPKGTIILIDLTSLHNDETYWKYPHEFNPENFLNEDGELRQVESFLPFSAGPRSCLGENLARMELFLFLTSLLIHFEFHCSDPASPPDINPVFGITQSPKCFTVRLVSRR